MKPEVAESTAKDLYEQDFFEWTLRNAELLRAGQFQEADIAHIAEELEDMGKREHRELHSRLVVLLVHLLKWRLEPGIRSRSWRATINTQRRDIAELLEWMPSLRPALVRGLSKAYRKAVEDAIDEMGLLQPDFPAQCPYSLEQIFDTLFFPE
jgi:hypothetical protein